MARKYFYRSLMAACFAATASLTAYANGEPKSKVHIHNYPEMTLLLNDTVPDVKRIPEAKTDSASKANAIKEVPKSKKQVAPVAVDVKPIKIIKPKIIKPVIKIN